MKLCVNCRYLEKNTQGNYTCSSPANSHNQVDVVSGQKYLVYRYNPNPYTLRFEEKACGKEANWFVPKLKEVGI